MQKVTGHGVLESSIC